MGYSDYGGYAYRNGRRAEDRSDATITPEGDTYGTPGSYPGLILLNSGLPHDEVLKQASWPSGHAVLGDGPVYTVLRKQCAAVYRGPELRVSIDRDCSDEDGEQRKIYEVDVVKIEAIMTDEDNYYIYVRMTEPDGDIWHGWSGYGVGAGLEDADYGYSTADREAKIKELWPESIA